MQTWVITVYSYRNLENTLFKNRQDSYERLKGGTERYSTYTKFAVPEEKRTNELKNIKYILQEDFPEIKDLKQ